MPERGESHIHTQRSGFTLVELIIVLVAITIIAGFAIPRFFSQPEVTLDNAALLLAQDLRDAQNRAAYNHLGMNVHFFPDGGGYEVIDERGDPANAPIGPGPFLRKYSHDAIFTGVELSAIDVEGGNVLEYDRRGFAQQAAYLALRFQGAERYITVARDTGLITIEGLAETWEDDGR